MFGSTQTRNQTTPGWSGWSGNNLLELFIQNSIDSHVPRSNTGEVYVEKHGSACCVQKDEPLPRVFNKMIKENFLGMPVLDGRKYIGFISMLDLVKHVNSMFWGDTEDDWIDYWSKSEDFASTTVQDVIEVPDQWQRDPCPPVLSSMSTMYALELMVRTKQHRMAVLDPQSKRVCSVLTHSMLISFVRQASDKWAGFGDLKVSQMLGDLKKPVLSCLNTDSAINAFNLMEDNEVQGIAIVDSENRLKGSISIRDLRGVGSDGANFFRLYSSVADFKRSARRENPDLAPSATHYENVRTPVSGLFVTANQTINDVIQLLHDGNIHRVYVCASRNNPVPTHVISQRDVLLACLNHIVELSGSSAERTFTPGGTRFGGKYMEEEKEEVEDEFINGNGKRSRAQTDRYTASESIRRRTISID